MTGNSRGAGVRHIKLIASAAGLVFLYMLFASTLYFMWTDSWRAATIVVCVIATPICLYLWHQVEQQSWFSWLGLSIGLATLFGFFLSIDCFIAPFVRNAPSVCNGKTGIPVSTMLIGGIALIAIGSAFRAFILEKIE